TAMWTGNNSNTVSGPTSTVSAITVVDLNDGTNIVTLQSLNNNIGLLGSSFNNNTLIGPNATTIWNITGTNAGNLGVSGFTVNFTGVPNLTGGTGIDGFSFSDGAGLTGSLNGGAGNNVLSFLAYTTGVTVNLSTGSSSHISGGVTNIVG